MTNIGNSKLKVKQIMQVLDEVETNANHPAHDRNHPEYQSSNKAIQSLRGEINAIYDEE